MTSKRERRKKGSDAIAPPKPDEAKIFAETLHAQGLSADTIMGKSGPLEFPEGLKHLQKGSQSEQNVGQQFGAEGSDHFRRGSKEEMEDLMRKLGVGESAGKSREERGLQPMDEIPGINELQSRFPGTGSNQGIPGIRGGIPGFGAMQGGVGGQSGFQGLGGMQGGMGRETQSYGEEESAMSQEEIIRLFGGLDDLSEKDKEAALLAMGGPGLLQQYQQSIGPAMQQMRLQGGGSERTGPGGGGMLGSGSGHVPGAGGMLGNGARQRGKTDGNPMNILGRGGRSGIGGTGFPGTGRGGIPGMGGGRITGMGGGGIPGMGGGIPGMGEMNQENIMQMLQQFQLLESMSAKDKEEALLAIGGEEYVQMYNEKIAPMMQQMGMGQGGMLGALGRGAGGLFGGGLMGGQGLGGLFGGQGGGGRGIPGSGGIIGGQVQGPGGQNGLGSLFGSGARNSRSGGTSQRTIDPKTLEGLENLSEEDKRAALEAMGNPDLGQNETETPPSRPRYTEPPPQPYEPIGPGMYQFHRRQPLQLPIHSGGVESRRQIDCIMPTSRRRKRFGERPLVRTHGSSIDLEGYYKHLVETWSKEALACKDPMSNGASTILVLDVSESMRGEQIKQAVDAIEIFIEGLEENKQNYGLEENLGLLVFHGDTFDVTHLTNDYSKIKHVLATLKDVEGSSPLIMTLAVIQGIAAKAKVVNIKGHHVLCRAIIFSDFIVTPPGFDTTQEEYVRDRVQHSVDTNFYENTQDLIHDYHVRLWAVPVEGEYTREWFANRICQDGFGEKVFPEDAKWMCRNYICEKIVAECKTKLAPLNPENPDDEPDEARVKQIAESMFEDVDEDDIEFVMKRLKEKLQRPPLTKRQRREKKLQDQIDRAEAIARGENPPPLPEDNKKEKKGRKSLEELLGIDSDDDDEEDDEETDLLFRLPGLLGDEEDAENDPLTKQKIEELLEYYGGGPPKTDNLPLMPGIGTRVKKGPDWMWQKNEIADGVEGTIISIDKDEPGWVKVRWDPALGSNEPVNEEDYRFGLDYEFDVEPVNGGMKAVKWPPGKERKIVEPIWLQELNREKEELAELRRKIEEEKKKEEKEKNGENGELKTEKTEQETTTQTSDNDGWSDLSSLTSETPQEGQVCYVWQYQDNDGLWKTYDTDTQAKLEGTYIKRKGKGTVIIGFNGHDERVVFEKMEQRRIDKKNNRQVRRIEADAERLKELQEMFSS